MLQSIKKNINIRERLKAKAINCDFRRLSSWFCENKPIINLKIGEDWGNAVTVDKLILGLVDHLFTPQQL